MGDVLPPCARLNSGATSTLGGGTACLSPPVNGVNSALHSSLGAWATRPSRSLIRLPVSPALSSNAACVEGGTNGLGRGGGNGVGRVRALGSDTGGGVRSMGDKVNSATPGVHKPPICRPHCLRLSTPAPFWALYLGLNPCRHSRGALQICHWLSPAVLPSGPFPWLPPYGGCRRVWNPPAGLYKRVQAVPPTE